MRYVIAMLLLGCAPAPVEWCLTPAPDAAPYCYVQRSDCEQELSEADRAVGVCFARTMGDAGQ